MSSLRRIVVGVTGASGVVLAQRLLTVLKGVETHLIVSEAAELVIKEELKGFNLSSLASYTHSPRDLSSPLSSGSYPVDGVVVIPCSMKTLGAIASGVTDNLITRAVDVSLKEGRRVVLVPRETPLSLIHLRNLLLCKIAGCVILPPLLSFYPEPKSVEDTIDFVVGRVLDSLGIENNLYKRWKIRD